MTDNHESPLLTIQQSAEYLGISRTSIYRLISDDKIETTRVLPRKQHITRDALDKYINSQTGKKTEGAPRGYAQ